MPPKTEKKLEMVPAKSTAFAAESAVGSNATLMSVVSTTGAPIPDDAEKLNLPAMVDLKVVPVGVTISGEVVRLVENFTGREDMRKARLLYMTHASGTEFLLPVTGVIKNALKTFITEDKDDEEVYTLKPEIIGRTLYVTRQPDAPSKKYGGKPMFMFDVRLAKK